MGFFTRSAFFFGVILIASGFYLAFTIREQLQAQHHGNGMIPAIEFNGTSVPVTAAKIPIAVLVILGLAFAMFGFVDRNKLKAARLADQTKFERYDQHVVTDFMHFNHRGTLASKNDSSIVSSGSKDAEAKKKE